MFWLSRGQIWSNFQIWMLIISIYWIVLYETVSCFFAGRGQHYQLLQWLLLFTISTFDFITDYWMETDEMYNSIDLNIKQPIIRKKVQHAPKIKSACVIVSFCQIQKNMVFFDQGFEFSWESFYFCSLMWQ